MQVNIYNKIASASPLSPVVFVGEDKFSHMVGTISFDGRRVCKNKSNYIRFGYAFSEKRREEIKSSLPKIGANPVLMENRLRKFQHFFLRALNEKL